jgi:hypothetical protein
MKSPYAFKVEPLKTPSVHRKDGTVDVGVPLVDHLRQQVIDARVTPLPQLDGATLYGVVELTTVTGATVRGVVIQRKRPFVPFGTDPAAVNEECARLFAIVPRAGTELFDIIEVTP